MKKAGLFLCVLLISYVTPCLTQNEKEIESVNTLTIYPNHPIASDTIWVVATGQISGYLYCYTQSRTVTVGQGTVSIVSVYTVMISSGSTSCNTKDSLRLGPLSPGNYSLTFTMKDAFNFHGSKSIIFNVSDDYLGIKNPEIGFNRINVYPNPSNSGKFSWSKYENNFVDEWELFNSTGGQVFFKSCLKPEEKIDLSDQPDGLYFLRLMSSTASRTIQLLKGGSD